MNLAPIRQALPRLGAVAVGGFIGGTLRYLVADALGTPSAAPTANSAWSHADARLLLVNSLGVAIAVYLVLGPLRPRPADDPLRLVIMTGGLGGLTTYSNLLFELGRMWQISPVDASLWGLLSLGCGALAASGAALYPRRRVRGTRAEF